MVAEIRSQFQQIIVLLTNPDSPPAASLGSGYNFLHSNAPQWDRLLARMLAMFDNVRNWELGVQYFEKA